MMVVIQRDHPKVAGFTTLEYTAHKLEKIEACIPSEWFVWLGIPGAPASMAAVLSHLLTTSVVHFACHGEQNLQNPLDSTLILHDGRLRVSDIMKQMCLWLF
jgi:CHAT domain-containing protein